jgi:DNA polymerase-3 subunit beta
MFCDKFLGILNSIPDSEFEFEQEDSRIVIKPITKKIKFQLRTTAEESFPPLPEPNNENFFSLPVKEFKDMVRQTIFAVSDDETRYNMCGVFFEKKEGKFSMVATDGRRLAFVSKDLGDAIPDFDGVIVPPKILNIIVRRAGDEGNIDLSITDRVIFARFGSYNLSAQLIEGKFPDFRRVIPENHENRFTLNRLETLEAIKRISIFVDNSHRIWLKLAAGSLTIYSEEGELGEASEEIPCKYDGAEFSFAMNYRYLDEPFKSIDAEEVTIHFTDTAKAVTIKSEPESDVLHVVMPMQV